jgi:hypothetical protein
MPPSKKNTTNKSNNENLSDIALQPPKDDVSKEVEAPVEGKFQLLSVVHGAHYVCHVLMTVVLYFMTKYVLPCIT